MKSFSKVLTGCTLGAVVAFGAAALSAPAFAEANGAFNDPSRTEFAPRKATYQPAWHDLATTYSPEEILAAGHGFFGKTTNGLAKVVQHSFGYQGAPSGYIIGEEASGAFFGGLRYGEGTLHMKNGTRRKIYWQGPSFGFDAGGNGARTMVLVYHLRSPEQLYNRFGGIEGSAYLVGGAGVNFQRSDELVLAPIRTGVGVRLGANIGYLKYTRQPTWNPF